MKNHFTNREITIYILKFKFETFQKRDYTFQNVYILVPIYHVLGISMRQAITFLKFEVISYYTSIPRQIQVAQVHWEWVLFFFLQAISMILDQPALFVLGRRKGTTRAVGFGVENELGFDRIFFKSNVKLNIMSHII